MGSVSARRPLRAAAHTVRCAALVLVQGAWAIPALAAPVVYVPGDVSSINDAVDLVDAGGTILVDGSFIHNEPDGVWVSKDLTIKGDNGHPELPGLVISSSRVTLEQATITGKYPLLYASAHGFSLYVDGSELTLNDVEVVPDQSIGLYSIFSTVSAVGLVASNHDNAAAVIAFGGTLDITNGTFASNQTGAIAAESTRIRVTDSVFTDNTTSTSGADIYAFYGGLTVSGSTFAGSDAGTGGSLAVWDANVTIDGTSFQDCTADYGGCLVVSTLTATTPAVSITDTTFEDSRANVWGGCVYLDRTDSHLSGVGFLGCRAGDPPTIAIAGSLALYQGTAFIDGTSFEQGFADNGGAIAATGTDLTIHGAAFFDLEANYGAGISTYAADVAITDSTVSRVEAAEAGGFLYAERGTTSIEGTSFEDPGAVYGAGLYQIGGKVRMATNSIRSASAVVGGGAYVDGSTVEFTDNAVWDSTAQSGAGLWVANLPAGQITRNLFCHNIADNGGTGMTLAGSGGRLWVTNNIVQGGHTPDSGAVLITPGINPLPAEPAPVELRNNTFVDTRLSAATVIIEDYPVNVVNNIFYDGLLGLQATGTATITGQYNLWWDLDSAVLADDSTAVPMPSSSAVFDDPLFEDPTPWPPPYETNGGVCGEANYSLSQGSPATHAGDPDILNTDGSRSHIGAYGGPFTPTGDQDGDGWSDDIDCDDDAVDIHPGATEVWYDDVDDDCDGNTHDRDSDGYDVDVDCDDGNASIHPQAEEIPGDGVDQDCSTQRWVGGGACNSAGGGAGWWLTALLLYRRRRP